MQNCSQCGAANQDNSEFCIQCGARMGNVAQPGGPPPQAPQQPAAQVPPQAPQPQYAAPQQYAGAGYQVPNDGMAVASLVMGIGAFFICPLVLGILAIIFANMAMKNIEQSGGTVGGAGMAKAGLIMGWINIGLVIVVGIIILILVIAGVWSTSNAAVTYLAAMSMG